MNQKNFMPAMVAANFLAAQASKGNNGGLAPSIISDLQKGNIELQPGGLIHCTQFTEGNIVELLISSNNRANGKSDFNGKKLDANQAFVLTGIRIAYADAVGNNPAAVAYDSDRENLPAALVNSMFEVHQDGKRKIRIPVSRLLTQVNADSQSGDLYQLPGMILLAGDSETDIKLLMPEGATIGATNNNFARIEFEGFQTRTRS